MSSEQPTEKSTQWGLLIGIVIVLTFAAMFLLPVLLPGVDTSTTSNSISTFAVLALGAIFGQQLKQAAEQREAAEERRLKAEAAAAAKQAQIEQKVGQLAKDVDGRMSQLLEKTELLSHAVGKGEGVEQERTRTEASAAPPVVTEADTTHPMVVGEPVVVVRPGVAPVEVVIQQKGS